MEHWVIVFKDEIPVDFIRCAPGRSEQERQEWENDGYTVTIEEADNPSEDRILARLKELGL